MVKKKGLVSKYCEKCIYLQGAGLKTCDYMITKGEPRGCPAGDGCTRKEVKAKKKKGITYSMKGSKSYGKEIHD